MTRGLCSAASVHLPIRFWHGRMARSRRNFPNSRAIDGFRRPEVRALCDESTLPGSLLATTASRPEFLNTLPIDFQPEPRRLRQAHHATANLGPAAVNGVVDRVAGRIAMRFGGERGVAERRDQMTVQMAHRMRCDQHALLFGIVSDPQRFSESGMPR